MARRLPPALPAVSGSDSGFLTRWDLLGSVSCQQLQRFLSSRRWREGITNQLLYQLSYAGIPLESMIYENVRFAASHTVQAATESQYANARECCRDRAQENPEAGDSVSGRFLILAVTMPLL